MKEMVDVGDFEIDPDEEIPVCLVAGFEFFEDVEIEIPDDIDAAALEEIEDPLVPLDIPVVVVQQEQSPPTSTTPTAVNVLSCELCGKKYKKKAYFDKHTSTCGKSLL